MSSTYPSPRPRIRIRATPDNAPRGTPPDATTTEAPRMVVDPEPVRRKRKREPNKGSFQPNQSGNPKGRPRGAKGVKAMVRKAFAMPIEIQTARGPKKVAIFEALLKKEVSMAAEGDWRARRTVFELGKWALGDTVDQPFSAHASAPEELTATGQAIIEWFKDEITEQSRAEGDEL